MIAQGDYLQTQVNYSQGALRYMWGGPTPTNFERETSNTAGFGILSDCVFFSGNGSASSPNSGCNLTTGWNVNAAFEHYWTPALHQSLVESGLQQQLQFVGCEFPPAMGRDQVVLSGRGKHVAGESLCHHRQQRRECLGRYGANAQGLPALIG
jgi:hypothetical protein